MPTPPPRYLYQRRGGPLLSWVNGPPRSSSQAVRDLGGMGSLGSTDVFAQPRNLPRGGAPEYIPSMGCSEAAEQDRDQGEYIIMARGPINVPRGKLDVALDIANIGLTGAALYVLYKILKKSP